jgi:hypothetical protein
MKISKNHFTPSGMRLLAAVVMATTFAFTSGAAFSADKEDHEDRAELRIKDMHSKLMISTPQEGQWKVVSAVMLDNAKVMDKLTERRYEHARTMTAVDDLSSYGEIAEAHAAGIRKLVPAFSALYASMSEAQKKEADNLFRHGDDAQRSGK